MAFGQLKLAKRIMANSPKYNVIIEPFGDNGSVAFYPNKKRPKSHIVNYSDIEMFTIMSFIQGLSGSDKKALKSKDWIGSKETFDSVVTINAIDGVDFFYKYFYLNNFAERTLDKEAPPAFDFLMFGMDIKDILYELPIQKAALKKVTLTNEDPGSLISSGGGDSFMILVPNGQEQVDVVESKINGLSSNYYYAKKIMSNQELIDAVKSNIDKTVSSFAQASIMMAKMQVITNYESKLKPIVLDDNMKM